MERGFPRCYCAEFLVRVVSLRIDRSFPSPPCPPHQPPCRKSECNISLAPTWHSVPSSASLHSQRDSRPVAFYCTAVLPCCLVRKIRYPPSNELNAARKIQISTQ